MLGHALCWQAASARLWFGLICIGAGRFWHEPAAPRDSAQCDAPACV
jgi:hypothetical protein